MLETGPTLIVVPHVDAGDRNAWADDQDLRPLSDLGREQADRLAAEIGTVDAVFSSPARRCTETVAPLADVSAVEIVMMDELRELTYVVEHLAWQPRAPELSEFVLPAAGVGRMMRAVTAIANRVPRGRVAVCAHGDLVPLFGAFAAAYLGTALPGPIARGGWFEVDLWDPKGGVRARGALLADQ